MLCNDTKVTHLHHFLYYLHSYFFIIAKNVPQIFKSRQHDATGIIKQQSTELIGLSAP